MDSRVTQAAGEATKPSGEDVRAGLGRDRSVAAWVAPLQDLRMMGVIGISELRAAITTLGIAAPAAATTVTFTAEQAGELARLLASRGKLAHTHDEHNLAERATAFMRLLP